MLSSQPSGRGFTSRPATSNYQVRDLIAGNGRRAIHHPISGHSLGDRQRQEFDMSSLNAQTIAEFRANEGRVGGTSEGAPLVLVHHRGRKSGREYVTPTMYLPHDTEPDIISYSQPRAERPRTPTGTTT